MLRHHFMYVTQNYKEKVSVLSSQLILIKVRKSVASHLLINVRRFVT